MIADLFARMILDLMPKRHLKKIFGPGLTGPIVRVCPGKRHAWIQSRVGLIRKPISAL